MKAILVIAQEVKVDIDDSLELEDVMHLLREAPPYISVTGAGDHASGRRGAYSYTTTRVVAIDQKSQDEMRNEETEGLKLLNLDEIETRIKPARYIENEEIFELALIARDLLDELRRLREKYRSLLTRGEMREFRVNSERRPPDLESTSSRHPLEK